MPAFDRWEVEPQTHNAHILSAKTISMPSQKSTHDWCKHTMLHLKLFPKPIIPTKVSLYILVRIQPNVLQHLLPNNDLNLT